MFTPPNRPIRQRARLALAAAVALVATACSVDRVRLTVPATDPALEARSGALGDAPHQLTGSVVDALSGHPIAGARVVDVDTGLDATTDADGAFALSGVAGPRTLEVRVEGTDPRTWLRWEHQESSGRPLRAFAPASTPSPATSWGSPLAVRPAPTGPAPSGPVTLPADWIGLSVGGALPETIRVGRRFSDTCAGHDVTRIDDVPLEEYVEGVLIPEIGVFQRIEGGPDSAAAVFRAFAIAARSYAVWWYLNHPDDPFHIDDTACNQRYDDARSAWVAEQVAATRGQILVRAGDEDTLDKLEYAASCGRHGTRPEYQDALVDDEPRSHACVGSWCGHDGCAGHEVNPALPDAGRCLVRGVCQWGAAERSMDGESYTEILAHYQPNTTLVTFAPSETSVVGFVRVGDVYSGPAVFGATVEADFGGSTTTDARGYFSLTPPDGVVIASLSASAPGFVEAVQAVPIRAGETNWASFALIAEPSEDVGAEDVGAGDTSLDVDAGPDRDVSSDTTGTSDSGDTDTATFDTAGPDTARPGPDASTAPALARVSLADDSTSVTGCAASPPSAPGGGGLALLFAACFAGLARTRRASRRR